MISLRRKAIGSVIFASFLPLMLIMLPVRADTLNQGITPATDPAAVPAAARLRKDTLVAGISEPQGIFNPYFFTNGWDENVTEVIFARLIGWDSQGKLVPELAQSWQVSNDNKTYTIKLRPGLVYSDGSPLTAEDIAFTLTILYDPSYDGEYDISLAHIAGGNEYKAGTAHSISGIKVIDPLTISITTTEPGATTLQTIGGPVLSKAYYGKHYQQGNLDELRALHGKPLGNGPYIYEKYIPGQEIRFHANPLYFAGKPAMARFIYRVTNAATNFQLFQTGETDYDGFTSRPDDIEQLKQLGFANIYLFGSSDYSMVAFNHKRDYLHDKRVRQALIYGLNREQLVEVVYQGYGQVANEPIAPISWAYDPQRNNDYRFNLQKANQLLDDAGWKRGSDGIRIKDGKRLELTLLTTGNITTDALVPIAKEDYRQLGVVLKPEILDFNALLARQKAGNFDLISYRTSSLNDPHDGVQEFQTLQSRIGYSNPEVDKLIAQGNATLDPQARKPIYHQLYQVLAEDPPVIFLAYRDLLSASSARVTGFNPDIYNGLVGNLPKIGLKQ